MSEDQLTGNESVRENVAESSPAEQSPEEGSQTQNTTADVPEQQQPEPEKKERNASSRIRDLVSENKRLKEEMESQRYTSAPDNAQKQDFNQFQNQYQNPFQNQTEIDPNFLDAHITQRAEAMAELKLNQILSKRDAEDSNRRNIEKWSDDLETTERKLQEDFKDDPEIAEKISEKLANQMKKLNYSKDKKLKSELVNASDIYADVRDMVLDVYDRGKNKSKAHIETLSDEGALRPGMSREDTDSIGELSKRPWSNAGKIAAIYDRKR